MAVNIVEKQQKKQTNKKLRQQQEKPPQKQSSPIQVKMGTFGKNGGMRTKIGIKNRSAVAAVGRWEREEAARQLRLTNGRWRAEEQLDKRGFSEG